MCSKIPKNLKDLYILIIIIIIILLYAYFIQPFAGGTPYKEGSKKIYHFEGNESSVYH